MRRYPMPTLRKTALLLLVGLVPATGPVIAATAVDCTCVGTAEYAIRWNPKKGGPKSAEEVLAQFQLGHPEEDKYEIQYFDVASPVDAPPGFAPIARKRSKGEKTELTYKLRGPTVLPMSPSLAEWPCPLPSAAERKEEADISFISRHQSKAVYSRSCTAKSSIDGSTFPVPMSATPKGCSSTMRRLKAEGVKIEEWHLSNGAKLIEISQSGRDTHADREAFRDRFVDPLLAKGITPLDQSKSEMGSTCD
ncbi:hypothetical protein [Ideonella sp. YS5]|uniref:hypothetical protein n=1 Tax=Ideonella sp. YS5 TaxID=3453714 RepID=UPI003EECF447